MTIGYGYIPSDFMSGFLFMKSHLNKKEKHREKIKNKTAEFRVEFRFPKGTSHFINFETLKEAEESLDYLFRYSFFGDLIIENPISKYIYIRGKRNGWKRLKRVF